MKHFFLSLFTFLLASSILSGQTCDVMTSSQAPNIYLPPQDAVYYNYSTNLCLDIQFHIVRETDGSLAFTPKDRDDIINDLNKYFNPHQIFFSNAGVNYIDNSSYLDLSKNEYDSLIQVDNNPNALNFYIVTEMYDNVSGAAYVGTNEFVIKNNYSAYKFTSHEVGHCFGLEHTHETKYGVEAVNGSNCSNAGDLVCDTPADNRNGPNAITGHNPDVTNLMSYYGTTVDHFTKGQGYRMRQTILNNSNLQPLINGSCSISDIVWNYDNGAAICSNQDKTFELINLPSNSSVQWSTTSNITTTNSSANTITVRLSSYSSAAIITAKVTIYDRIYHFTLDLEQLSIPSSSNITLDSYNSLPILTDRWTNITARYNGLMDVGQFGYTWTWVVPSHQVRHNSPTYSYIHVNPVTNLTSVYIKTKATNQCGCSDWKGEWFTIEEPPTNGCSTCPTNPKVVHQ